MRTRLYVLHIMKYLVYNIFFINCVDLQEHRIFLTLVL